MIRVSTTTLEAFRKLLETDYGSEAEIIAQVRGEPSHSSWQMVAGCAWQDVLSRPADCLVPDDPDYGAPYYAPVDERAGGFIFRPEDVNRALAHLGPGLAEVKAVKTYDVGGRPVRVVAQADHVLGLVIQDNKAKFSTPDPRDYEPDLQWRFYLDVFQAQRFRYNLWPFSRPDDDGLLKLKDVVFFDFYPHPRLSAECGRWLARFIDWADSRGLLPHLAREGTTPGVPT